MEKTISFPDRDDPYVPQIGDVVDIQKEDSYMTVEILDKTNGKYEAIHYPTEEEFLVSPEEIIGLACREES